jgi:hypothetical protein
MPNYEDVAPNVTLLDQVRSKHSGPIVVVGTYTAPTEQMDDLFRCWTEVPQFMRHQPGRLYTQMHRGIGDANVLVNYAVCESLPAFRASFDNPRHHELDDQFPKDAVFRQVLVERIAIPGVCLK